ncbi:MAG: hypothetical protein J0L57_02895 [Burkholderiales bacterium]|nr:hypothetical protein [Burkholderiales bacterium]
MAVKSGTTFGADWRHSPLRSALPFGRFRPRMGHDRQRVHPQGEGARQVQRSDGGVECFARKGRHQTLYFGSTVTIVRNPKDELKTGTFHAMCSQLGIKPGDL